MSGETEQNVSGWTTDTVHAEVLRLLGLLEEQMHRRFDSEHHLIDLLEGQMQRRFDAEHKISVAELDVLRQRLSDIDRATELLNANVTRIPTDVDKQVGHLKEVVEERFTSVALQFTERDTRGERETRDNTIKVDAAFSAQEKSAARQEESNQKALSKSEASTADNIAKLEQLFTTSVGGLGDKIDANAKITADKTDDLKDAIKAIELRVQGVEQRTSGGRAEREDSRAINAEAIALRADQRSMMFLIVSIISAIIASGALIFAMTR